MKNLSLTELQPLILDWAKERNILFPENAPKQRLKLIEECGELASAILKNDIKLQKDAIGDIFVVITILASQTNNIIILHSIPNEIPNDFTNLFIKTIYTCNNLDYIPFVINYINKFCELLDLDLTECVNIAWNEIKNRKGKTVNGTFIKD